MLKRDGRVQTQCGCCGEAVDLTIRNGALSGNPGEIAHFAVPARNGWRDIVFT